MPTPTRGATTISAGTLSIGADANLGTRPASPTAGQLTFNGGTLLATASITLDANRGIALTGAGTITVNAAVSVSYAGIIAGASTLTKTGTGTLVLSGANTYTGDDRGQRRRAARPVQRRPRRSTAGTSVTSGAAIEIDGCGLSIAEPITSLNGTGIRAAGALRNLANDNTWSGTITLARRVAHQQRRRHAHLLGRLHRQHVHADPGRRRQHQHRRRHRHDHRRR